MSARLRFTPLHPHPPLAWAWWGAVAPTRYGPVVAARGATGRMGAVTPIKALPPIAETKPRERRKER